MKKFDVGIDIRMAHHTGIGTYVRGILNPLLEENRDLRLGLFGPEYEPWRGRAAFEDFSSPIYSIREQLEYPGRTRKCHVWHAPHYNVPLVRSGTRMVVTIHDLIHWIFRKAYFSRLQAGYAAVMLRAAVQGADHVITVSENTRQDLIRHFGARDSRISVIYEGVSPRFYDPEPAGAWETLRRRTGFPERFFFYVGLLKPHKNVHLLLRAWRRLRREKKITSGLVILGKKDKKYGPELADLAGLPAGASEDGLYYLPSAGGEELRTLYRRARALVHPSRYEGFGLTLLEAMASETPVMACRTASIPEVAGDAALLIEPDHEEALMDALVTLEQDERLREEMVRRGREQVRKFSWKKAADQTIHIYRQVLNQ